MSAQGERASPVDLWLTEVQRRAWPVVAELLTRTALYPRARPARAHRMSLPHPQQHKRLLPAAR